MRKLALAALVLFTCSATAQVLNENFKPIALTSSQKTRFIELPNQQLLAYGSDLNYVGNTAVKGLVRLNADGSIDNSFNPTGISFADKVLCAQILSNGQILVSMVGKALIKLNADGTQDTSFPVQSSSSVYPFTHPDWVQQIVQQSDGKILLAGPTSFSMYLSNGVVYNQPNLMRINPDGSLDLTFKGSKANGITDFVVQADGKIVAASNQSPYLARFNTDGTADNTLNLGAGFNGAIYKVKTTSDSKLVVAGQFSTINNVAKFGIARLNTDGSLDQSFNLPVTNANCASFDLQTTGRIVVSGVFTSLTASRILRLNTDGSVDNAYTNGLLQGDGVSAPLINMLSDNSFILSGSLASYAGTPLLSTVKVDAGGTRMASFIADVAAAANVTYITTDPNGKVLIAGNLRKVNGVFVSALVRLNSDGTLDNTFNNVNGVEGISGNSSPVSAIAFQADGKLLVSGYINKFAGASSYNFIRLNTDGTRDNTLALTSFIGLPTCIIPLDNGQIILGGSFNQINATTVNSLVRLNSNGSIDNTFSFTPTGFYIRGLIREDDGKLLLAYTKVDDGGVIRVQSNGSVDATFQALKALNYPSINVLSKSADGKIYVAGSFSDYGGSGLNNIVKLNTNGTIDNSFKANYAAGGSAPRDIITSMIERDGQAIATTVTNSRTVFSLVSFNAANGQISGYYSGKFNSDPVTFRLAGSSIFVAGNFSAANGAARSGIALFDLPSVVPPVPTPLTYKTSNGSSFVELTWPDQSSTESSFELQRSIETPDNFTTRAILSKDITTTQEGLSRFDLGNIFDLTSSKTFYRICAVNPAGKSAFSAVVEVPPIAPRPTNLKIESITSNQIVMTWADLETETSYEIYRNGQFLNTSTDGSILAANTTSYTDSKITANEAYSYEVRANSPTGSAKSFPTIATQKGFYKKSDEFTTTNRSMGIALNISGEIFYGMGKNLTGFKDVKSYNPTSKVAKTYPDFPGNAIFGYTAVAVQSGFFIIGGRDNALQELAEVWFLNLNYVGGKWFKLADFPGGPRAGASSFVVNNTIFVVGGSGGLEMKKDLWMSNSQGTSWTRLADFPGEARVFGIAGSIGQNGYYGLGDAGNSGPKKDFWQYNSLRNQWTLVKEFSGDARAFSAAASYANKIFVAGGASSSTTYSDTWEYDGASDVWKRCTDIPKPIAAGSLVVDRTRLLLLFGETTGPAQFNNEVLVYDPFVELPKPPANLTVEYKSGVKLSWTDGSINEERFVISRSENETTGYSKLDSVGFNDTFFTDETAGDGETYFYKVVSKNRAGESAPILSSIILAGVESNEDQISIYPNPTEGIFTITSPTSMRNVSVLDLSGKRILATEGNNELKTNFDISSLNPGMYVIQISLSDHAKTITRKIVKY